IRAVIEGCVSWSASAARLNEWWVATCAKASTCPKSTGATSLAINRAYSEHEQDKGSAYRRQEWSTEPLTVETVSSSGRSCGFQPAGAATRCRPAAEPNHEGTKTTR